VTAFEQYALRAFDVGAIDYLHKPVTRQRFLAAVERARERLVGRSKESARTLVAHAAALERGSGARTRFVVRRGNTHYFVPVDQVDWIDSADNYLRLHVGERSDFWRGTMKGAEAELDPKRFVRVHRSAIIAVDRVTAIHKEAIGYVIELRGGTRLRSSRRYVEQVRALIRVE
jgi:two-component system LytT family response regulator